MCFFKPFTLEGIHFTPQQAIFCELYFMIKVLFWLFGYSVVIYQILSSMYGINYNFKFLFVIFKKILLLSIYILITLS